MVNVTKWYATWCGPCKTIAPELDRMHEEGRINLTAMDIEACMPEARAAAIRGVPTLIVYDDEGKELKRFSDLGSLKQYLNTA